MSIKLVFITISGVMLLSGCGKFVMYKNGQPATQQQYDYDLLQCTQQAQSAVPVLPVQTTEVVNSNPYAAMASTMYPSQTTTCTQQSNRLTPTVNCNTYTQPNPMAALNQQSLVTRVHDGNIQARNDFINRCMSSKGYEERFIKSK